nr:MAG TPA: hypothetical protein [Caudoviricetes sp.]
MIRFTLFLRVLMLILLKETLFILKAKLGT